MSVGVMQTVLFGLGIAGAVVDSVFHANTAIVLSAIVFCVGFTVERSK